MDKQLHDFIDKYNLQSNVGNTTDNKGECVGLVSVWLDIFKGPHIWGHAFSLLVNADRNYYDVFENTPAAIPLPGDIIVWKQGFNGTFGHTAIITKATLNTFEVFEQNNPFGAPCQLKSYKSYAYVDGWLRPKSAVITQPIVQTVAINDQFKLPAAGLGWETDLELQQVRGLLFDLKQANKRIPEFELQINSLQQALKECQEKPTQVVTTSGTTSYVVTNSLSQFTPSQLFRAWLQSVFG